MGRCENRRQLRADHPQDKSTGEHHSEDHRSQNSMSFIMPKRRARRKHGRKWKMKLGRLLINTEIYPCVRRACVTLGAVRKIRIGQMQIKGHELKKHTTAYDEEAAAGTVELTHGQIEKCQMARTELHAWKTQFGD